MKNRLFFENDGKIRGEAVVIGLLVSGLCSMWFHQEPTTLFSTILYVASILGLIFFGIATTCWVVSRFCKE